MLLSWLIPWFWLNIFLLLGGGRRARGGLRRLSQPPHAAASQSAHAGPFAVLVLGKDEERRREGRGRGRRRQHQRRARQGLCPRRRRPDHRRRPAAGRPAIGRASPGPQDPLRGAEVAGLGDRAGLRAHDRLHPLPGRRRVDAPGADRARGGRPGPGRPEGPLRPGAQGAAGQAGGQVRRGVLGAAERELHQDGQGRKGVSRAGHDGPHAADGLRGIAAAAAPDRGGQGRGRTGPAEIRHAHRRLDAHRQGKPAETAGHRRPAPRDFAGTGQDRGHLDLPRHADRRAGRRGVRGQGHSPGHAGRPGHAGQDAGTTQGDPQPPQGFRDLVGHSRRRPADDDQGRALQARPLRAGVRRGGGRGQSLRRDREHCRDHVPERGRPEPRRHPAAGLPHAAQRDRRPRPGQRQDRSSWSAKRLPRKGGWP